MKLTTATVRARQRELVVNLGDGVTVIHGPNGSGKTTLTAMIAWVLSGTLEAGGAVSKSNKSVLRSLSHDGKCPVDCHLEFDDGAVRRGISPVLSASGEVKKVPSSFDSSIDFAGASGALTKVSTTAEIQTLATSSPKARRSWMMGLAESLGVVTSAEEVVSSGVCGEMVNSVVEDWLPPYSGIQILEAVTARAANRASSTKDLLSSANAVLRHCAESSSDSDSSPRSAGEIDMDIERVRKEISQLRQEAAANNTNIRKRDAIKHRLETLNSQRSRVTKLREDFERLKNEESEAEDALDDALANHNQVAADAASRVADLNSSLGQKLQELASMRTASESARASIGLGECITCGSDLSNSDIHQRAQDLEDSASGVQSIIDEMEARIDELSTPTRAHPEMGGAMDNAAGLRLYNARIQLDKKRSERTSVQAALHEAESNIGDDTEDQLSAELESIECADPGFYELSTSGAEAQLGELHDEKASMAVSLDRERAVAGARAGVASATEAHDAACRDRDIATGALSDFGQRVFNSVSQYINDALADLDGWVDSLKFVADYSDGFIGVERGSARIALQDLSDGEKLAVFSVLQIAKQQPSFWRNIVVDGADAMDEARFLSFIKMLNGFISSGKLDQALVTTARMSASERRAINKKNSGITLVEL